MFRLSQEGEEFVKNELTRYEDRQSAILPALYRVQKENDGWISAECITYLSGLMDMGPAIGDEPFKVKASPKCERCGMTYYDFQKKGKLGCGDCYEKFGKNLSELLRKIHGSDRHVGKMPFKGERTIKEQEDLKRLKDELNRMIQQEEFEKAAMLRDRIKELEEKMAGETGENESR